MRPIRSLVFFVILAGWMAAWIYVARNVDLTIMPWYIWAGLVLLSSLLLEPFYRRTRY